ncbi:MAG: hypothetical protein LUC36_04025, partial [Oscillospiraceae bacterium]|nr:hypothetical protein [Oscillospiraceae bacterium]
AIALGVALCGALEGAEGGRGGIWPGNIYIDGNNVELGPPTDRSINNMGPDALEYIPPEHFWSGEITAAGDVYSVGLVLYTVLNGGALPFSEAGEKATSSARASALQQRMKGAAADYPRTAGRELGDVILKAIAFNATDRWPDAASLRAALEALPEGADIPAVAPVLPMTDEEIQATRQYKVDKEFEKTEPPKPKKPTPPPTEDADDKTVERFRAPKSSRKPWIIAAVIAVIVIIAIILLRGCSSGEEEPAPTEAHSVVLVSPQPTVEPTPAVTAEPDAAVETEEPEPMEEPEPTYEVYLEDVTWEQAKERCEMLGGHLATIKSQEQLDAVIELAESVNARYVWLGAYRSEGGLWTYVTGEQMMFAEWDSGEPSAYDSDGTAEDYLIMWHRRDTGEWCYNDTRNDPISVLPTSYSGRIAYVCQYD